MSTGFFVIGCLFLLAGVAYLANLMGLSVTYVMLPVLIVVGVGAATGVHGARRTRI